MRFLPKFKNLKRSCNGLASPAAFTDATAVPTFAQPDARSNARPDQDLSPATPAATPTSATAGVRH